MGGLRFSKLSTARQAFIRECQRIGFGRIEQLEISDSEPVFGLRTQAFIDLKLDADERPRPELSVDDFVVSTEIQRLFSKLDAICDGVVEHIEVRAGIPRRIVLKHNSVERR
jgi:hypothetical protein